MHGIRFGLPKGTAVAATTKYAALFYANVGLEKYESAKENLRLASEAIEALGTTAYKAARENGASEVGFVDFENGNFALREDSSVYAANPHFKPLPYDRMGRTLVD